MATHPLNLALRFVLELSALGALGLYGLSLGQGPVRYLSAVGLPLLTAALWGTFAVPGDPSRSGGAPVPVPGLLRLALELVIFGAATWALYRTKGASWGIALAGLVIFHYALSHDRISWLLGSR